MVHATVGAHLRPAGRGHGFPRSHGPSDRSRLPASREIEAMQIVDAHHHLWDLEQHHYPWLANPVEHPAGDLEPIRRSYRLSDFLHDARNQDLMKSVHLQAAMDDPVEETAWLQGLADDPAGRG